MQHANFTAVCVIEVELLPIEVLYCGDFPRFMYVPVTLILELDPKAFESIGLQTDKETDRHNRNYIYHTPLRVVNKISVCDQKIKTYNLFEK